MKCSQCRKISKELDSTWDRLRVALMNWLFTQDVLDLKQELYTQGFGDGYTKGRDHQRADDKRTALELYNVQL